MELGDARALFPVLDCRTRGAFYGIVENRRAAAALMSSDYPDRERREGVRALGDAATARDAADLFSMRCRERCLAQLGGVLGAPLEIRCDADASGNFEVLTSRGKPVRLHRCEDGTVGLDWFTPELFAEQNHAARELRQVQRNAATYRKRRDLAMALGPLPSLETGLDWHP